MGLADPLKSVILSMWASVRLSRLRSVAFNSNLSKHKSHTPCKPTPPIIMSQTFAEFLLDNANNGNEILAVLEDIVEVTETGGTDL